MQQYLQACAVENSSTFIRHPRTEIGFMELQNQLGPQGMKEED